MPTLAKASSTKLYFSQYGGEQPIPPEFIAAMERKEEIQANPDSTEPETLSDTIIESRVETDRTDERVRHTIKKKAGNITLSKIRTNEKGQPVQVVQTLYPTGTTPAVPTATITVAVQDLGNGWSIQEVGTEGTYVDGVFTPGVFTGNMFARERPNLVPEKFRASVQTVTTRTDEAGTAADPTLSGDELRESQEQLTQFVKRTTIETQAAPTTPVNLSGKGYTSEFGGGATDIQQNLLNSLPTPTGSLGLIKHVVTPTGDGRYLEEKEVITAGTLPVLHGQEYDRTTGIPIQYTEQIIEEGQDIGTANCEITPLDENRARKKVYTLPTTALLAISYVIPGFIDLSLPNQLISLTVVYSSSEGEGEYTEDGAGDSGGQSVSLTLGFSGRGQGSASVQPELVPVVKSGLRRDVPKKDVVGYIANNATISDLATRVGVILGGSVNLWPKFRPQGHTIILKGQRASVTANAAVQQHYNASDTTATFTYSVGEGTSREIDTINKVYQLEETIHGAITIGGAAPLIKHAIATATATITGAGAWPSRGGTPVEIDQEITGELSATSLSATDGITAIPTSGNYMRDVVMEPYPAGGCMRFRATVVNFTGV